MHEGRSFSRNWSKSALFTIGTTSFNPNRGETPLQRILGNRLRNLSAARVGGYLIALVSVVLLLCVSGWAASGPFAGLDGNWSGSGTLRPANAAAERIRCNAHYQVIGQHNIKLQLRCDSDTYQFDLLGDFDADERGHLSGGWTESTRGVFGTIVGQVQGNRMLIRAAAPGFFADLLLVTSNRRQSATINSEAGAQAVKASVTLNRR